MRRIPRYILILLATCAAALVACAALSVAPDSGTCFPAAVPQDFQRWPVVAVQAGMVRMEDGGWKPFVSVLHERGGRKVSALWMLGILVFVDPNPDARDGPVWVERGAVGRSGRLLREPRQSCDWELTGTRGA